MISRLMGCGTALVGVALVYLSFHADEYGLGQWKGVGEGDYLFTITGLAVLAIGLLMLLARRDPPEYR